MDVQPQNRGLPASLRPSRVSEPTTFRARSHAAANPIIWTRDGKGQLDGGGALPDALRPQNRSAENAEFIPGRFADWCRVPDINTPTCP